MPMPLASTQPPLLRHNHGDWLIKQADLHHRALSNFNQRATIIPILLRIGFDFFNDQTLQGGRLINQLFKLLLLGTLLRLFLFDLDALETRKLSQTHIEDVIGLSLG